MKTKYKNMITILLSLIIIMSAQMVVVSAKEDNGVSINISTDKRVYQKGDEVNATVSIQNKNNFDIKNISLVSTLPAGITTENNSNLNLEGKSLKAGEKTSISFKAKIASVTEVKNEQSTSTVTEDHNATKDNQTDNTKTDATADSKIDTITDATKTEENTTLSTSTYDNKQGILIFCFIIISIIGIGWSIKNRNSTIKKISMILCLLVGVQLFTTNLKVEAAEVSTKEIKFDVEKDLLVGEDALKFKIQFTSNYEVQTKSSDIIYSKDELIADEDVDKDGLTNGEEEKIGTNPYKQDSDNDSLSDYDEVKSINTDPLNEDTDGDGVLDGEEIAFKLNPLQKKTDGVNIDGTKSFEKEVISDSKDVKVKVKGNSGILSTTIDDKTLAAFNSFSGLYSKVKNLHCNEKIDSAVITFTYSDKDLKSKKMNEKDLSIFYFNEDTKAFEKVPSTIDTVNKIVSAQVNHFSSYALADSTKLGSYEGTEVSFLIDNSGSMYPKKLCIDSEENDVDFKRVDFANSLIDKLAAAKGEKFEFSSAKFTATFTNLANMTSDAEAVKKSISSIKDSNENFNGTYIGTSMKTVLDKYQEDDYKHKKYIVLLTDGETTEGSGLFSWNKYPSEDIRDLALEKGVVVFAVGLGNKVDKNYLMKMSTETGGDYFIASDANALDGIYKKIVQSINYSEIDKNEDGVTDSIVVADSNFKPEINGFSFPNGRLLETKNGFCYGMAEFAEKYYTKTLPLSLNELHIDNHSTDRQEAKGSYEWRAKGYDLKDDSFFSSINSSNAKPLYTYTPKVYLLNPENCNGKEELYYDSDSTYIQYKLDKKKVLEESGFVIEKQSYKGNYKDFSYLDIYSKNFESNADSSEVQLFRALYRFYILQMSDSNLTNSESCIARDKQETLNKLQSLLNQKIPTTITLGGHGVNATRLIQDKDNPNNYILYLYDNNYPGEEKQMIITRNVETNILGNESYTYDVNYTTSDYSYSQLNVVSNLNLDN